MFTLICLSIASLQKRLTIYMCVVNYQTIWTHVHQKWTKSLTSDSHLQGCALINHCMIILTPKNCWAMQWYIILQDWLDFFDLLWKNLSIYVKWVKKPQLQIHFVMPASANCMSRHCCETFTLLFTYTFTYTGLYLYMYLYLMLMSFFPGFFKHLFWIFFTYTDIPKEYAHAALSVLCQHL